MTKVMTPAELVAATFNKSLTCFTVGKDGTQVPDYRNVVITVLNENGSEKIYRFSRQNQLYKGHKHIIESYTKPVDATWYNPSTGKNWKQYDNDGFDKRLKKLARELRKENYQVYYI